jgi:hypothetical protein
MNSVVLKFFDAYLKGNGKPDIEKITDKGF